MSLLDTASLICTPNGYNEGKLYSVIPSDGSGDLSVTRATTATRVNSAGLVELVPYNLVQHSEDFTNAAWAVTLTSITANSETAPDGTLTADTLTANGSFGLHALTQTGNSINGTTYTHSIYAKKNTNDFIQLFGTFSIYTIGTVFANFDLNSGVVGSVGFGTTASIQDIGNGWYRCTMTATATATTTGNFIGTCLVTSATSARAESNNLTTSVFIWGAQLNEGTILPYQKTETRLNIPRLDYSNGTCPSILVEPQRTNTILNSVLSGTTSLPTSWANSFFDGSSFPTASIFSNIGQAYTFITNNQRQIIFQNQNVVAGTSYAMSVFVESVTGSIPVTEIFALLGTGTTIYYKENQLINGTDLVESGYRYTLVKVAGATTFVQARIGNGCGTTTTGTVVLSMPQLEAGSYPTSYIPTTSASVTRNADVISKTGISSLIGQTEGTLFVEIFADAIATLARGIMYVSDGTTSNRVAIQYNGAGNLQAIASSGGTTQGSVVYSYIGNAKIAFVYSATNYELFVNGFSRGTFVGSLPITLNRLDLGSVITLAQMGGIIKAAALWKTRLTNDELATLTTI